MNQQMFC